MTTMSTSRAIMTTKPTLPMAIMAHAHSGTSPLSHVTAGASDGSSLVAVVGCVVCVGCDGCVGSA